MTKVQAMKKPRRRVILEMLNEKVFMFGHRLSFKLFHYSLQQKNVFN